MGKSLGLDFKNQGLRSVPSSTLQRRKDGYQMLRLGVEGTGGLVEQQHAWVHEEGARDGDALLLAAAQPHAPLADERLVTLGKGLDEAVGKSRRCCSFHLHFHFFPFAHTCFIKQPFVSLGSAYATFRAGEGPQGVDTHERDRKSEERGGQESEMGHLGEVRQTSALTLTLGQKRGVSHLGE